MLWVGSGRREVGIETVAPGCGFLDWTHMRGKCGGRVNMANQPYTQSGRGEFAEGVHLGGYSCGSSTRGGCGCAENLRSQKGVLPFSMLNRNGPPKKKDEMPANSATNAIPNLGQMTSDSGCRGGDWLS